MKVNKKVLNATINTFNNIEFKSKLERSVYTTLLQEGFNPSYEPYTFVLWEGFQPITPFYDKETKSQRQKRLNNGDPRIATLLSLKNSKLISIHYTPDFFFQYEGIDIYIEAKGKENDVFYIKKKLFIKYLDNKFLTTKVSSMYFEIYSKKQLLQAIDIIKRYATQKTYIQY